MVDERSWQAMAPLEPTPAERGVAAFPDSKPICVFVNNPAVTSGVAGMGKEVWRQERAELQVVLDELHSGQLRLQHGRDEYIASVKRRIELLEEMLAKAE